MDEHIEKLIGHAGGAGRYQIIILIIGFFVWSSLSLHNTSDAILETVPDVKHLKDGKLKEEKFDYDFCNERDRGEPYEYSEEIGFSWVMDMEIECNKAKVGLIGSFVNFGLTTGSLLFSIMTKYLTYRDLIIYFTFEYVFFVFLTTVVDSFEFRLFCLFCLGIGNGMANMSTMTLVTESVISTRRSFFGSVINAGYSFCPIMYTPLYVILGKWKYIFWLQNIIGITTAVMNLIILENSPRVYFSKNKTEEAIDVLKRIASFNGKLEEFEEKIQDKEFDPILRNEQEGVEKDLTVEMKPQYGYSALLKYKSVRYKFLIFTFMFMSTTFLTQAVVINVKSMEGNTYVILVSLYVVEVIAGICCGFLINVPTLGRKKSLIGFYLGITLGFILTLIFADSAIGCWLAMVLIRFCITGVYTTFYIYFMENYPTPLRSLGFGLNSTFGNLAGIISPLIIEFINKYLLYLVFAVLSGVNIFFTFFLKETVGKPMLETIEELDADVDREKLIPGRESDMRPSDATDKNEPSAKDNKDKKEEEEKEKGETAEE
jgi:predicted MFS family arabinose efflux permease